MYHNNALPNYGQYMGSDTTSCLLLAAILHRPSYLKQYIKWIKVKTFINYLNFLTILKLINRVFNKILHPFNWLILIVLFAGSTYLLIKGSTLTVFIILSVSIGQWPVRTARIAYSI